MIKLKEGVKILISTEPIDARKSIDSLSCLIPDKFCDNPQSGNLFLFFNKARDKVKILYWDQVGFVLYCITSDWKNTVLLCQDSQVYLI